MEIARKLAQDRSPNFVMNALRSVRGRECGLVKVWSDECEWPPYTSFQGAWHIILTSALTDNPSPRLCSLLLHPHVYFPPSRLAGQLKHCQAVVAVMWPSTWHFALTCSPLLLDGWHYMEFLIASSPDSSNTSRKRPKVSPPWGGESSGEKGSVRSQGCRVMQAVSFACGRFAFFRYIPDLPQGCFFWLHKILFLSKALNKVKCRTSLADHYSPSNPELRSAKVTVYSTLVNRHVHYCGTASCNTLHQVHVLYCTPNAL